MAKREWVLGLGDTKLVSAIVDPEHKWIGCKACGSCWLGHLDQAQEELCPYCECDGEIVPVDLRTGFPLGTEEAKMGLSEALEHLGNLVDIAAPEDTHYPQALKTVCDAVEVLALLQGDLRQAVELLRDGEVGVVCNQLQATLDIHWPERR